MRSAGEIALLFAAGLVPVAAYLAAGLWLVRATGAVARGAERWALAYALGTGACSLAILALRSLDVPLPLPVWLAVALLGLPARRAGLDGRGGPAEATPAWSRAVDGSSLAVAALTLVAALGPETYWDGFEYHLPMVTAWVEGPVRALPALLDAELRAGVDLLYVPAVTAGRPDAAAAVTAGFALALAALVRAEATRRSTPGAGALAGLFVLLVPLTVDGAASTYVDLGAGVYGLLALLCADRWNRGGATRDLFLSVVFLGFVANAKLNAALFVPVVAALVVLGGRVPPPGVWLRAGALLAALIAPWFAKVGATTGNPLFPLLGSWLGTDGYSPALIDLRAFRLSTDYPVERSLGGFASYCASVFFGRNPHVSGLIGPLPLALAPFAWSRPSRPTLVLVALLAALFVFQFVWMPAFRFATPWLPLLAVATAVGGARVASAGRWASLWLGALLCVLALHHLAGMAIEYGPRVPALRAPDAYTRARFPDQVALVAMVADAEPVVAIPKGAVHWMPKPVYLLHWERNGELFLERAQPDRARAVLDRRGVRSLVVDVAPPHPGDGRTGWRVIDAWLASGEARLVARPDPPPARGDERWVRVDLVAR